MTEDTDKEITELRAILLRNIKKVFRENKSDQTVQYSDVSKAFPGGPHEHSFEIRAIDQDALKQWCSENGFESTLLTKEEDPENFKRGFPPVRFWRRGKIGNQ